MCVCVGEQAVSARFQKKVVQRLRPILSTDRYTSRYNVIVDTIKKA